MHNAISIIDDKLLSVSRTEASLAVILKNRRCFIALSIFASGKKNSVRYSGN